MHCPACEGKLVRIIGELIRIPGLFELSHPGWLHHCGTCNLYFRRPFLNPDELRAAYERIPETHWVYDDMRQDQVLAVNTLMNLKKKGDLLDVGCYRGDFLQRFPSAFVRYGIEPSNAAAKIAEEKGVKILGPTLEETDFHGLRFDIVSLIDVLEHLPFPFHALENLKALLNPNGILLVTTGNTGSLLWRLMRLDYWYYTAEHVSFFNPPWFRWVSRKLGLKILEMRRFSHHKGTFGMRCRQVSQGLAFLVVRRLSRHPALGNLVSRMYPFNRALHWASPPPARSCKDHLLVTFKFAT